MRNVRLIISFGLLLAIVVHASCAPAQTFDRRLGSIVKPYTFSIAQWELRTVPREIKEAIFDRHEPVDDEVDVVLGYFSILDRIRNLQAELLPIVLSSDSGEGDSAALITELNKLLSQKAELTYTVERIIERQIRQALVQQGIFNPVIKVRVSFPPVNFTLEEPPHLLVVSPRDRIESMREITLKQSISPEEIDGIETEVDGLGVSSLVVELGGFGGTFPSFVSDNSILKFTIEAALEEWLHQYLVCTPLGFLYLLDSTGVSRNYEIATINETVASMVSKEIGSILYNKYYSHDENGANQSQERDTEFDFNQEMRQIRRAVDEYLSQGEIEQAEEFMEEKRLYLVSKGYYIRKLNQAYFAFHGTYADSPTSISPIGVELRQLREQSGSVKDFLDRVVVMTSRQDLMESVK